MELDEQGTPGVDVEQGGGDPGNSGESASGNAEPFLAVNERVKYNTREDAVRAYDEAGKRIAALSGWEKTAKQWGLDDPTQLDKVANELLELRKFRDEAKKVAEAKPAVTTPSDPKKAGEEKQVREYLTNLGYLSKDEVNKIVADLKGEIDSLKSQGSQQDETRLQNQVEEGQQTIKSWLADAKIQDADGSTQTKVENFIKRLVNGDEEAVATWNRGGVAAKALLKESYDLAIKALGLQPTAAANGADANYAANKAKAVATNKKLPAPGTANKQGKEEQPGKRRSDFTPDLHERAWAAVQKMRA